MLLVSIDGLRDAHDRLRGKGTFNRVVENLSTTTVHKRALISLSRGNIHQLEDILAFFAPLVNSFWFSFVYDYHTRESHAALSSEEKKVAATKILSLWKTYPIANSLSYLNNIGSHRQCRDWLLSTVTSDGTVHSGCMITDLHSQLLSPNFMYW